MCPGVKHCRGSPAVVMRSEMTQGCVCIICESLGFDENDKKNEARGGIYVAAEVK